MPCYHGNAHVIHISTSTHVQLGINRVSVSKGKHYFCITLMVDFLNLGHYNCMIK